MFSAASKLFKARGAQLLGISVDGPWCHEEFKEQRNVAFPLLADSNPKGDVAKAYGVYRRRRRHIGARPLRHRPRRQGRVE